MRLIRFMAGAIAAIQAASSQTTLIEQVRENSLTYVTQLPNFICEEVIDRSYSYVGTGGWTHTDTVKVQVTYFDAHEEYTHVRVNDKPIADSAWASMQGVMAEGDFGSLLRGIFETQTQARFEPEHAKKLRGRQMALFKYDVKQENSRYRMSDGAKELTPAFRGEIYVDEETKMVMRLVLTPYNLPRDFRILSLSTSIDYQIINVSGKPYLLPQRAEIITGQGSFTTMNVETYHNYRKFGTQTNLTFDAPETPAH